MDQKWSALPVPYAIEVPDRAPEGALLRPGVLRPRGRAALAPGLADGVPARGDPRARRLRRRTRSSTSRSSWCAADDGEVRAFQNACRHRGVRLVDGPGHLRAAASPARSTAGATARTAPTPASRMRKSFDRAQPRARRHRPDAGALRAVGRRARGSTSTTTRRRCASASSRPPPSSTRGRSSRCAPSGGTPAACPVNWKLAQQAFQEQYHVVQAHPQLVIPGHALRRPGRRVRPPGVRRRRDPVPAHDERGHGRHGPRQRRARRRGPARHRAARRRRRRRTATWNRTLNDAVVDWHRGDGQRHPRPQRARGRGPERADGLLLPALLRAADVQQRVVLPVPPARAGGDADGDLVAHPVPRGRPSGRGRRRPRCGSATTPAGRRSRPRTSRTCPASSWACTPRASSTCACPRRPRATSRTSSGRIDGFLAGLPHEQLLPRPARGQREPARPARSSSSTCDGPDPGLTPDADDAPPAEPSGASMPRGEALLRGRLRACPSPGR